MSHVAAEPAGKPSSSPRRSRPRLKAARRFAGAVLSTSGVLLLADAGLTLAWQEPVSALMASRAQSTLRADLPAEIRQVRRDQRELDRGGDLRAQRVALAGRARRRARTGMGIGEIHLPTLGRRYALAQGTDGTSLRKGPGHYPRTAFPGEGRTIGIAGHRTTYGAPFRTIDRLRPADPIVLEMPYGRFTYRVERTRIVPPSATWVVRDVSGAERLVLTACHPLYSAAQRIVVFARLSSAKPS